VIRCDALVVGGGPAGSTCARGLKAAGWNVVVADGARFPRDKVCAGWVTPEVFQLLDLDPDEYRATGLTFQEITAFRTGLLGRRLRETRYPRVVSYGIRRCEFDDFLLRRAGVRVLEGTPVTTLRARGDIWVVNESIEAAIVIGAGGHFCPVARHLRGGVDAMRPVVAKEAEFRASRAIAALQSTAPALFFCDDFGGYGWCVPKGEYLNVGIGHRDSHAFASHFRSFVEFLERSGLLTDASTLRWKGHAYLAAGTGPRPLVGDGLLVVGDAAGLAYPESGEGIRPAVESGKLAADVLAGVDGRRRAEDLASYAAAVRRLHPPAPAPARHPAMRAAVRAGGRVLLGVPALTRRIVLDRWFLRATQDTNRPIAVVTQG
jgi:menaquinone-9 beta-reductase